MELNPPQREAVLHVEGPLVVFAGAGSGKTRVITHRVAHLVGTEGVPPWKVLAVTFTNKAAGEMRERLAVLLGDQARDLWVGTFHATCARLLRRYAEPIRIRRDFTIYDDSDQQAMVKRVVRDMGLDERRYAPKAVAGRINRAKQEVVGPGEMETGDAYSEVIQRIYDQYEKRMDMCDALDFGDLIYRLVVALEEEEALRREIAGRFEHVLVDEFQDTNHAQLRLVKALGRDHRNVCVVGDDDQSIYRWRGADRRNILDFREHFPEARVVKLEQNYRSTQRVLRVAHAIISKNLDREPKQLWTENREGPKALVVRCEDERDEARMLVKAVDELRAENRGLEDVAVFYRTHAQSRVLEEALRSANIAYRVVGGMRFYDRAEIKDVIAYLRVLHNPGDDVSLLRIINTPARGIGKTSIGRVQDWAAEHGTGIWQALRHAGDNPRIGNAAAKRIRAFVELMEGLMAEVQDGTELIHLAQDVVDRSGYKAMLEGDDTPEADARIENIKELLGSVQEFQMEAEEPSLSSFLELITLQTSADETEMEGEKLTLMTVHAAKGLEFPVVMVTGLEEQMFPMSRGELYEDPEEMEEERRLAYVAFTRAQERLILSFAGRRLIFGQPRVGQPSRFLLELPEDDVQWVGVKPVAATASHHARGSWRDYEPGPTRAPRSADEVYSGDSYVDTSEAYDEELRLGMRVRHAKFGVGTVRAVDPGLPPRVSVEFPGWGLKRITASYLEPA